MIFVGDDWADDHHDICVMNNAGEVLAQRRLDEGVAGLDALHGLLAAHGDEPGEVVVGIETDRGLWVQALAAGGYQVHGINPKAAARYRERHNLSGAKCDRTDAKLLADLVRTDRHNHRLVAGDSDLAEGIKILARAQQTMIWDRTRQTNRLRAALREYFPAALSTFDELSDRDTLAVLGQAPSPEAAKALSLNQLRSALRAGGRQRYIDKRAKEIAAGLRVVTLSAPGPISNALAATTRSTVAVIVELNRQIQALNNQLAAHFDQHPDADIYLSQPGIGVIIGARVLGEFGDDPNRYANPKARKNYAGTSPITRQSGRQLHVMARFVRNTRLIDALSTWALCSLSASPGARAFYDQRRASGDTHQMALRALANRLVGILHGCLASHSPYNERKAWAHRNDIDLTEKNQKIA